MNLTKSPAKPTFVVGIEAMGRNLMDTTSTNLAPSPNTEALLAWWKENVPDAPPSPSTAQMVRIPVAVCAIQICFAAALFYSVVTNHVNPGFTRIAGLSTFVFIFALLAPTKYMRKLTRHNRMTPTLVKRLSSQVPEGLLSAALDELQQAERPSIVWLAVSLVTYAHHLDSDHPLALAVRDGLLRALPALARGPGALEYEQERLLASLTLTFILPEKVRQELSGVVNREVTLAALEVLAAKGGAPTLAIFKMRSRIGTNPSLRPTIDKCVAQIRQRQRTPVVGDLLLRSAVLPDQRVTLLMRAVAPTNQPVGDHLLRPETHDTPVYESSRESLPLNH